MARRTFSITMESDLLDALDTFAREMGLNRSQAVELVTRAVIVGGGAYRDSFAGLFEASATHARKRLERVGKTA